MRIAPPPSNVEWTFGKGVIGRCWQLGQDLGIDLQAHFAGLGALSADQWAHLAEEDTLGLTFEEFQRTRQHAIVVATPILDRSRPQRHRGRIGGLARGPAGAARGTTTFETSSVGAAITIRNLLE